MAARRTLIGIAAAPNFRRCAGAACSVKNVNTIEGYALLNFEAAIDIVASGKIKIIHLRNA